MTTNVTTYSKDWWFKIQPSNIRTISSNKLTTPKWFLRNSGELNMVNLSFFTGRTFIPPYKDSIAIDLRNPNGWPILCIGDSCKLLNDGDNLVGDAKYIVSGYPALLYNGQKSYIRKSFFSRRVCPRTAIGICNDGDLIVLVSTGSNLRNLQDKMHKLGCHSALNLDGGSSTFLYLNGKRVFPKKHNREYPNVLTWRQ